MSGTPVDSHLELLVIEGEDKGVSFPLKHSHLELGRRQSSDVHSETRIAFAEPTVSGQHAALEWSAKDHGYLVHHRSKTNSTLINGKAVETSQLLKEGDTVQMGLLLAKLVPTVARAGPAGAVIESGFRLLVMTGPEKGDIHPLGARRSVLRSSNKAEKHADDLNIGGLGDSQIEVTERNGQVYIQPLSLSNTLKIFRAWPGVLLERTLAVGKSHAVQESSLIACGFVAFTLAREAEASLRREDIAEGKPGHPGVTHVTPPGTHSFLFTGPQEDTIRVLSGPNRGEKFWLTPADFTTPFRLGRGDLADYSFNDGQLPETEFSWQDGLHLRNLDAALSILVNGEELAPGGERSLCSGDRFKLGDSELTFECATIQYHLGKLSLRFDDEDMPFLREINILGKGAHADFFVNADELAEAHGRLQVSRRGVVTYYHLDPHSEAKIGETTLKAGEEHSLAKGQQLVLGPHMVFQLKAL